MSVSVVIADDHEVVRVGLTAVLVEDGSLEVVAEAASAREALEAVSAHRPDVLILDVRLPDRPGTAIVDEVRRLSPATKILILTSYGEGRVLADVLAKDVDGFLIKTIDSTALIQAVKDLARGRRMSGDQMRESFERLVVPDQASGGRHAGALTPREMQIASLVAQGLSNREIGMHLGLSEKTIRNYVSEVLSKWGLERRGQLIAALRDAAQPEPGP